MNLEQLAKSKGFTVGQLTQFGLRNAQGGVLVPYRDPQGNEYIRSRVLRDPTPSNKDGRFWSKGEAPIIPYGLERPVPCNKGLMWIVEGESDCWTLWLNDVPALGVPGTQQFAKLQLEHLEGVRELAVVEEPDDAGRRFPHQIATHLYDRGFPGRIFAVPLSEKDPRQLWVQRNGAFLEALRADYKANRRLIERPLLDTPVVGTTSVALEDVFDLPEEDVEWLVEGLIPKGGVTLLSAKPKVGKTTFARNIALAVARSSRFLGRQCSGGVVLWVHLEGKKADVINGFKALGAQRTDPIRFHFGHAPADAIAWLQREVEAYKPVLIVLDTWHKLTLIENINDYGAVNRANAPLMELAHEKGVAQIWVHHNNKSVAGNGDEVLGSQALFAAADVLVTMTRGNDGVRAFRTIQRVGSDIEETVLAMDAAGHIADSGSRFVAQVEAAKPLIIEALGAEDLSRHEVLGAVEARRSVAAAALNELIRDGLVAKAGGIGKRGDPIRYRSHQNLLSDEDEVDRKGGSRELGSRKETPEPETSEPERWFPDSGNSSEPPETAVSPEPAETETDAQVEAEFDRGGISFDEADAHARSLGL